MVGKYQLEEFVRQAHRAGEAGLTICSSGNLSWRIGEVALVSGTGSWIPELKPDNVSVCRIGTAEMPLHVGRVIPVIPFRLPGTPELAEAVVEAMKNRNAIQLAKHGQVVCGRDFDDVFQRAMFFEMGCRIVYQALQAGKEPDVFTEEELDEIEMHYLGYTTKDGLKL